MSKTNPTNADDDLPLRLSENEEDDWLDALLLAHQLEAKQQAGKGDFMTTAGAAMNRLELEVARLMIQRSFAS